MAKDFDYEINPDTGSDANNDIGFDLGDDIAGDDGVDLNGENSSDSMSKSKLAMIGAGTLAGLAAISGPVSSSVQGENMNDGYGDTNNVPAVYAETDAPLVLDQMVEQELPDGYQISNPDEVLSALGREESELPDKGRAAADLAGNIQDMAEAAAEGKKLRDRQDEIGELGNTLRGPEYSDNTGLPEKIHHLMILTLRMMKQMNKLCK
jgi:hypothetical protein